MAAAPMTHSLTEAAQPLLSPEQLWSADQIRARPSVVPATPAIYGWWFDAGLPRVPTEGALLRDGRRLLYVGIAPRGPSPDGAPQGRTLRDRLKNHCRGPIASSTLRRTLACVLARVLDFHIHLRSPGKLGMRDADERRLTEWMQEHARVGWMITTEPWVLEEVLITAGPRLPLNIRSSSDPFRLESRRLRAAAAAGNSPL